MLVKKKLRYDKFIVKALTLEPPYDRLIKCIGVVL